MAAAVEGTCFECGEPCEVPFTSHTGCCPHEDEVEPSLGYGGDPAREDPDHGVCQTCGAEVHVEVDGPMYSDESPRAVWVAD